MTSDEWHERLKKKRHERIRRVKKLLRPLPRRATVHRYPFLKWFAETARKRSYLWSFRRQHVIPTFYVGCILSLMPIYGVQIPFALALALVLRFNLMFMVGTQLLTNPLTFVPLYTAACFIGLQVLYLFGYDLPVGSAWDFSVIIATHLKEMVGSIVGPSTPKETFNALTNATGMDGHQLVGLAFKATVIGGTILGYFIGFIASCTYQGIANYYSRHQEAIQREIEALKRKSTKSPMPKSSSRNDKTLPGRTP